MRRIITKDLECIIYRLNKITNSPNESYTKHKDGTYTANIGNYYLDWAYGGVTLHRMRAGGGVENVLHCGYVSKKDLYRLLQAFIAGIDTAQPNKNTCQSNKS